MTFEKELGQRIRRLRKVEEITQDELASRAGISTGALSQIERGIIAPSIITFKLIIDALGYSFSEFFEKEDFEKFIIFRKNSYQFLLKENIDFTLLTPLGGNKSFDIFKVSIPPSVKTRKEEPHKGEEAGVVLQGALMFYFGKKKVKIRKGESYFFIPDKPHYFENRSKNKACIFYHITSPPHLNIF